MGSLPQTPISMGMLTSGPNVSLIARTVLFVLEELPKWRDDPERPAVSGEELLNAQFCKYLNAAACDHFPMVLFSHEEKQTGIRRVDFAAGPRQGTFVGETYHTVYDPFIVFEGKRLPAPSVAREKEYVTGGSAKSGGIQRFKLAQHGAQHAVAALVGYVQSGSLNEWFAQINQWIEGEVNQPSVASEPWSSTEALSGFAENLIEQTARSSSLHARVQPSLTPEIELIHLWIKI